MIATIIDLIIDPHDSNRKMLTNNGVTDISFNRYDCECGHKDYVYELEKFKTFTVYGNPTLTADAQKYYDLHVEELEKRKQIKELENMIAMAKWELMRIDNRRKELLEVEESKKERAILCGMLGGDIKASSCNASCRYYSVALNGCGK